MLPTIKMTIKLQDAITAEVTLTPRLASRPLIAPAWHTIVFIAIFVGLSIAGGFFSTP
jgi:hypothetical protein